MEEDIVAYAQIYANWNEIEDKAKEQFDSKALINMGLKTSKLVNAFKFTAIIGSKAQGQVSERPEREGPVSLLNSVEWWFYVMSTILRIANR
jgi:hypothetical protein